MKKLLLKVKLLSIFSLQNYNYIIITGTYNKY